MPGHDIITVGASAGGVEALMKLAAGLPADLPAAVFIVLHIPADSRSLLPRLLSRAGPLPATSPEDGAPVRHGQLYVARPDHHLLIHDGYIRVVRGPRENRQRPAVDPLFRSAARWYGSRVVGVVLTGSLDDGTAGLVAIKQRGGVAVVQDPQQALYPSMPTSALAHVDADYCLPLDDIPVLLVRLASAPNDQRAVSPASEALMRETAIAELDMESIQNEERPGQPSVFSCPECKGVLWELEDGDLLRFRCRVGHAFSPGSFLSEQSAAVEEALWIALNTLQERASLYRRLARQSQQAGREIMVARFEARARDAEQRAALIQNVLLQQPRDAALHDEPVSGHGG